MNVSLRPDEVLQATQTGVFRYTQNMRLGRKDAYGAEQGTGHGIWLSIVGAWGEAAVAKALNVYHFGMGIFRGDDISGAQVRTSNTLGRQLILHPRDLLENKDEPYVSVSYDGMSDGAENFTIQGWGTPAELVEDKYFMDYHGNGRPAYFIPVSCLRPISELQLSLEAAQCQ